MQYQRWRRSLLAIGAALAVSLQGLALPGSALAASAPAAATQQAKFVGTFIPAAQGAGSATGGATDEIPPHEPNSKTLRHVAAAGAPSASGDAVASGAAAGFAGFSGLTHLDQRSAGTGEYTNTQFSLEPPDQGLCVGGGFVTEAVNNAMQVFSPAGAALTPPIALSQFFGLKPEVVRSTPPVYGDFISDPRCYYDPGTARWFLTELQIDIDPATGDYGTASHLLIAVSNSADPTQTWSIYELTTTDDGSAGTPADSGCPCFGDQPLIGADANGFYLSTNEYSIAGPEFNGAQLYALSKTGLEAGTNTTAVHINAGPLLQSYGGLAFSIQPASAPAGKYETANNGTEYFLSAMDFGAAPALGTRAASLAVWALTNTASLGTTNPAVSLSNVVIASEAYSQPPNATQKKGPTPLAASVHSPEELVATNDDRLNQVVFADGKLWAGLNTAVSVPNGPVVTGAAYFIVTPADAAGTLSARIAKQGYVAVNRENVIFPSIGVTDAGKGIMTFTLVGPDYYPSAAYTTLDAVSGAGPVYIAGAGVAPDDGFSGYKAYGGNGVGRWGDYTAAVADASGTVWFAAEHIPNAPRTALANWGTFIAHVTP